MVIGYFEGVNNIVIISNDNKRIRRKLSIKGLNVCGKNYTYYNMDGLLHILDMNYIKEIKLYRDKEYISSIYNDHLI